MFAASSLDSPAKAAASFFPEGLGLRESIFRLGFGDRLLERTLPSLAIAHKFVIQSLGRLALRRNLVLHHLQHRDDFADGVDRGSAVSGHGGRSREARQEHGARK